MKIVGKIRDLRKAEKYNVYELKGTELQYKITVPDKAGLQGEIEKLKKSEAMAQGKATKRGKAFEERTVVVVPFQKEKNVDKMVRKTLKGAGIELPSEERTIEQLTAEFNAAEL